MLDRRFPRTARLLSAGDYQRVFARPKRSADAYFTVLAARRGGEEARLGLAVSRKQVRRAVDRSRLKRLAREVFRLNRDAFPGIDFVVMARTAAVRADNGRLQASLERHFRRLGAAGGDATSGR